MLIIKRNQQQLSVVSRPKQNNRLPIEFGLHRNRAHSQAIACHRIHSVCNVDTFRFHCAMCSFSMPFHNAPERIAVE